VFTLTQLLTSAIVGSIEGADLIDARVLSVSGFHTSTG
jgi:hypothetical protein